MTDGPTEGQREFSGNQGQPAAAEADARPRVMVLGSGEPSRELATALRHLGAEVIAVDDYADAPAHGVADQSLVIPMTDADELAKVIQGWDPISW